MSLPISVRLSLVFGSVMVVLLALFGWSLSIRTQADLYAAVDQGLRARASVLSGTIGSVSHGLIQENGNYIQSDDSTAQVIAANGTIIDSSTNVTGHTILDHAQLEKLASSRSFTKRLSGFDDQFRFFVTRYSQQGPDGFIIVGANLGDTKDAIAALRHDYLVGAVAALAGVMIAGWWLIRSALRPVEAMRKRAAALSLDEPGGLLPVPSGDDELGRLARTLNSMLDRMRDAHENERRFIDYASHELRTPLTIIRTEIDLALARRRTEEQLTGALVSAGEEVDQLIRLSEDLLTLSSTNRHGMSILRVELPLKDVLLPACASLTQRATVQGVSIGTDIDDTRAHLDPRFMRQAVTNLLDNALRYSPSGSTITVAGHLVGDEVTVDVVDQGAGFPTGFLGQAFEPFSTSGREPDGSGLGLAIVAAIANAHGGSAEVANLPGGGARVRLVFPTVVTGPIGSGDTDRRPSTGPGPPDLEGSSPVGPG